ncbi:MAG TPA: endonuclease III [Methanotrichaceae archaeon]|nr:endonuclease III [Methanotrichaceae archaeon]
MNSKAEQCIEILEDLYGVPQAGDIDPLDLLVQTMLSQNTTDTNSFQAFRNLKTAYPNYEDLLAASDEDIAELIRVGGLAETKARRIKEALIKIKRDAGAIDLSFLASMSREGAEEYLLALPGVGPKTTAVVLLFAFGFPVMPVDTHVHRVSGRLGLVPEGASIKETQRILEEIVPQDKYLSLHLNLIWHGRRICKARGPKHEECALRTLCDYYLRATTLK